MIFFRREPATTSVAQFRKTTFYPRYNWFVTVRPRALSAQANRRWKAHCATIFARGKSTHACDSWRGSRRIIGRVSQKDRSPGACGLIWGTRFARRYQYFPPSRGASPTIVLLSRLLETNGISLPYLSKSNWNHGVNGPSIRGAIDHARDVSCVVKWRYRVYHYLCTEC